MTGASSGLGRATALELAGRGCRLVLAARRVELLREVAAACRRKGGDALVVRTDVTREGDVQRLVRRALTRWGRVDVWINNAGTTLFAPLEEGDFAAHRRVVETNLFGAMHGARAVLPVFRRQGAGTLVNVGSVLSEVGQPFVPAYVVSKFGLRGLSEALRAELADHPAIHVCTILPYAIDTPHFQAGANLVGRETRALPPVQSPEKVARAVAALMERPERERHVPRYAVLGLALHWLWPRATERLLLDALKAFHLAAPQPRTAGSLFEPSAAPGAVRGDRGPIVGVPAFVGWAVRDLASMARSSVARRFAGWRALTTP